MLKSELLKEVKELVNEALNYYPTEYFKAMRSENLNLTNGGDCRQYVLDSTTIKELKLMKAMLEILKGEQAEVIAKTEEAKAEAREINKNFKTMDREELVNAFDRNVKIHGDNFIKRLYTAVVNLVNEAREDLKEVAVEVEAVEEATVVELALIDRDRLRFDCPEELTPYALNGRRGEFCRRERENCKNCWAVVVRNWLGFKVSEEKYIKCMFDFILIEELGIESVKLTKNGDWLTAVITSRGKKHKCNVKISDWVHPIDKINLLMAEKTIILKV